MSASRLRMSYGGGYCGHMVARKAMIDGPLRRLMRLIIAALIGLAVGLLLVHR